MTTAEQKSIKELTALVNTLREENTKFAFKIQQYVDAINSKVEKKHLPIYAEQDILATVQTSIRDSIKTVLSGYNSPLTILVKSVVDENTSELREIISSSFNEVIKMKEFKESIVSAFSHKVARSIISNNDGLFDKVANELKQDSIFKSKMAIAVSNVVDECLLERKASIV